MISLWSSGAFPATAPDPDFRRALRFYRNAAFEQSARILAHLVKIHPENPLYWFNLGNSLFRLKQYEAAEEAYSKVESLHSPLAIPSELYRADCDAKLGKDSPAIELLDSLRQKQMPLALSRQVESLHEQLSNTLWEQQMNRGLAHYRSNNFGEALGNFLQAAKTHPSPDSQMMTGMTYLRLLDPADARSAFNRVLDSNAGPDLKEDAQEFLRQIREGHWRQEDPYYLTLDVSGGYNSNIFGNGYTETGVGEPVWQADLGGGYGFFPGRPVSLKLEYFLSSEQIVNLPDFQLVTQTLDGRLSYRTGGWLIQALPSIQYQLLGSLPFLTRAGGQFYLERSVGKSQFGLSYDHMSITSANPSYPYLAGTFQEGQIYWRYSAGAYDFNALFLIWSENIGDEVISTGTVPLANVTEGPEADLSWYPSPFWTLKASAAFLFSDYTNPDISRVDKQLRMGVRVSRGLRENLSLYFLTSMIFNSSTLGADSGVEDKNYSQIISKIGLSWDLLP